MVATAVGNRLSRDAGGALETLAYDAASNRLQTVTAAAVVRTLGYTASGNTDSDDDGLGTVLTNLYDSTDRMVEVKNGAATVAAYLHNASGQRVARTVGASTTHYIYAGGAIIAIVDAAGGISAASGLPPRKPRAATRAGSKIRYGIPGAIPALGARDAVRPLRRLDSAGPRV